MRLLGLLSGRDEEVVQNGIDFNNLTGMTNEPRQVGAEVVVRW